MAETLSWVKPKLMGALQILIGVACLSFGGVASIITEPFLTYWTLTVSTGYPFWGGIMFVASGSLSVAAEYVHKPILVKGSVGMNIVSAMFAATGITLLIVELVGNKVYGYSTSLDLLKADNGIAGMMLFISLLEFSIAILLSHHKSHATHHLPQPALPFASHAVSSNPAGLPIISSAPPAYCNDGYAP